MDEPIKIMYDLNDGSSKVYTLKEIEDGKLARYLAATNNNILSRKIIIPKQDY